MSKLHMEYFSQYKYAVLYPMLGLGSYANEVVGNCIEVDLSSSNYNDSARYLSSLLNTDWMNYFIEFLHAIPQINREKFICEAVKLNSYVDSGKNPAFYNASLFFNQVVIHNFVTEDIVPFPCWDEASNSMSIEQLKDDIQSKYVKFCNFAFASSRKLKALKSERLTVALILNYFKNSNLSDRDREIDFNATKELMIPLMMPISARLGKI